MPMLTMICFSRLSRNKAYCFGSGHSYLLDLCNQKIVFAGETSGYCARVCTEYHIDLPWLVCDDFHSLERCLFLCLDGMAG